MMDEQYVPAEVPDEAYEPVEMTDEEWAVVEAEMREREQEQRKERAEMIRRCSHTYRAALSWASIRDEQELAELLERVDAEMASGRFWLSRLGLSAQTDPMLTLTLSAIRQRWLEEYAVTTIPERILVDQAMIALYHQLRLHELAGNLEGRTEHEFFGTEPLRAVNLSTHDAISQYEVDEHLKRTSEKLMSAIARCHRMVMSSLRMLARWKRPDRVMIHNDGQVNLGVQQVNVAPRRRPKTVD